MIEKETSIDLSKFSTIKIGGIGKEIYFPKNPEEISYLIKKSLDENRKLIPIGIGSNLIFKDGILNHLFVSTKNLKKIQIEEKGEYVYITAEAGVSFKQIVELVKKYNLEGFENLSGIPASVGGAVAMNAGAFGTEIFDILKEIHWINSEGRLIISKKGEIKHSYRYTQFQKEGFVYKVTIVLKKSEKDIKQIIKNHLLERNKKQPLNLPTSGSTYKNPEKAPAGYLLEKAGFKGKRIGDIGFSQKHANFLVNYGDATYSQLIKLLRSAENTVKTLFDVQLEREVKIVE
ncbi:MAG: UDP-N-acetylmuramate dehydrogenase [Aquificae bacterium]|nr:UDP-N-acetylmuramate dehydrogenase [Aquificota bacterium]